MFGISSSFSDKLQTLVDRTDPVQRLTSTSWQQRQHTGNGVREDSWLFSCNNLMTPPNLGADSFSFAAHKSCQKSCLLGEFMEIFYVERFQYDSFRSSMPIFSQTFWKPPWCLSDIFEVELDNYFTNWTFSDILNCPTVFSTAVSTCQETRFGELTPRRPRVPETEFVLGGIDKCDAQALFVDGISLENDWYHMRVGYHIRVEYHRISLLITCIIVKMMVMMVMMVMMMMTTMMMMTMMIMMMMMMTTTMMMMMTTTTMMMMIFFFFFCRCCWCCCRWWSLSIFIYIWTVDGSASVSDTKAARRSGSDGRNTRRTVMDGTQLWGVWWR